MNDASESKAIVTVEPRSLPAYETRTGGGAVVPAIVAAGGDKVARRFLEFFAVTIDNPNTRAAYFRACRRFFASASWSISSRYTLRPISERSARILKSRPSSNT